MNNLARYIIITVVIALIGFILWYFKNIVAYILIASVLALLGRPVVDYLGKIKIKKFSIPKWLRALIALILIWSLFVKFFMFFIPLVTKEANELSKIDTDLVIERLDKPLDRLNNIFMQLDIEEGQYANVEDYIVDKVSAVLNISVLSSIFSTLAGLFGDIFIAIFSISFISFFFLKDEKLFSEGLVLLVPSKHEEAVRNALVSIRKLLMRYFIGIVGQITSIIILVTIGLSIVGINFNRSLVIALFVGIINIIPYVGPFIGALFGLIIGLASNLDLELSLLLLKLAYMAIVFISVQLIDNIVFQPLIYGSSVNAHPLEIFLIIMIAGSTAGIPGMILAIPTYTVFRVFAREFLYKFKVIKKITEKIP